MSENSCLSEASDVEVTDAELLAAIAGGDEAGLAALYDRYAAVLYAVCLRILRHHPDAEAVLSDVFWQVWSQAGKYNPSRGSARTYLMTLARSRAIDRWRTISARMARERGAQDDVLDGDLQNRSGDEPDRRAILDEDRQLVRAALGSLSQPQRTALELAYFGGRTHREIASDLQLPLGTVKTTIRQGLMKLRRSLGACEPSGRT